MCLIKDQEGLPDYWGIETVTRSTRISAICASIRKDYPTTGVLRPQTAQLKLNQIVKLDQEGLPDYWGIETCALVDANNIGNFYQEGLPDYWGIETTSIFTYILQSPLSGRITRLLGY